jgi:hypothetical protein
MASFARRLVHLNPDILPLLLTRPVKVAADQHARQQHKSPHKGDSGFRFEKSLALRALGADRVRTEGAHINRVPRGFAPARAIQLAALAAMLLMGLLVATPAGAQVLDHCPPKGNSKSGPVPGKQGEEGWLLQTHSDDAGNAIELWCLKKNDKHGGPSGAYLFRPKADPKDKAVWIGACVFDGGKNFPVLVGDDKNDATGANKPNGKPDVFTQFRQLNVAAPISGKDDWHYDFNPTTGKLRITKTEGHWKKKKDPKTGEENYLRAGFCNGYPHAIDRFSGKGRFRGRSGGSLPPEVESLI